MSLFPTSLEEAKTDTPRATSAELSFFVPGIPAPGGSKRGFAIKKNGEYTGRVAIVDAGGQRTRDWKAKCAQVAHENAPCFPDGVGRLLRGPLRVDFDFVMPRPQYHYRTAKGRTTEVKANAPKWPAKIPDRTKLMRSTEDALTGVIWHDDAQICTGMVSKCYGERPGCVVTVTQL